MYNDTKLKCNGCSKDFMGFQLNNDGECSVCSQADAIKVNAKADAQKRTDAEIMHSVKAQNLYAKEAQGVHWIWWVLWALAFFPALIIVAIVHTGRLNRAAIRSIKA